MILQLFIPLSLSLSFLPTIQSHIQLAYQPPLPPTHTHTRARTQYIFEMCQIKSVIVLPHCLRINTHNMNVM